MTAFAALADWGTTSFRLWLADSEAMVLAERRGSEGMSTAPQDTGGFAGVLDRHLASVDALEDLPVIACGMVGARQDWVEAPYVETPADPARVAGGAIRVLDAERSGLVPCWTQHRWIGWQTAEDSCWSARMSTPPCSPGPSNKA